MRPDQSHFVPLQSKDPGKPVRCAPPATPPPFRSATLVLKQVDPQQLGELGRAALSLFSSFWQDWERTKGATSEKAALEVEALLGQRGWDVRASVSPDRRFSGDGYLPRGRYHSVCHSPNGWDGGTMVRELTAYHDPLSTGIVDIHDVQDEMGPEAATYRDSADDPPVYLLAIPGFLRDAHPWLRSFDDGPDAAHVVLQAAVTEQSFRRLIDLRIPAVARWFTRNLTRLRWLSDDGDETAAFPRKAPLNRFVELLPSLLTQTLGGGGAASLIAGQWLRSFGADGLVFPSARSDASLAARGGVVERFHGWNLIDFRDAPPVRIHSTDLTAGWVRNIVVEVDQSPHVFHSDIKIGTGSPWRGEGSWSARGLQQSNAAFRTFRSALFLYRWAVGSDMPAATEAALTRGLAGQGSAASVGGEAAAFCRALLGDAELRQWFVAAFAELAPEDRAQLDLTAAFQGADSRLASWRKRLR